MNNMNRKKYNNRYFLKPALFTFAVGTSLIGTTPSYPAPIGDQSNIVSGSGTISANGNTTNITQVSQNIAIDWDSFNIQAGETVNFIQPNTMSIALNRDFSGVESAIFGNLNANGHVFILNNKGVLFGPDASVNVGSLLVSDMQLSDADIANFENLSLDNLQFTDADFASGGIEVLGNVVATGPNGITLMGQYLRIGGELSSSDGSINLNVGESAVLVTDPNGLLGVELIDPVSRDISPNGYLLSYPVPDDFVPPDNPNNAPIKIITRGEGTVNRHVKYNLDLDVIPQEEFGQEVQIQVNDPRYPPTNIIEGVEPQINVFPDVEDDLTNLVTESLTEEVPETSSSTASTTTTEKGSLDNIMEDCVPQDPSDRDCIKQNAIKRYLGKLLIGGSLPD
ncbi:MAG: filamentous hemagglutinin N-terminal domain-containing protein [Pseudomonadales bacterium]|nr:filamentous hemagglutinin N-terminal domain-containing protein [Pseudomonadales bacterium]